jgi:raffinose/stachyose/melibiose transport system substrate-binding protein
MFRTSALRITAAAVGAMVVAAGCGGDDTDAESNGTTGTDGGETADAGDSGDTEFEDVALEVYSWRPEDAEVYEELFNQFEEQHPGITVEFSPFSSTDYDQIVQSALQAGSAPDIIQMRSYERGRQISDQGYLAPIGDIEGIDTFDSEYLDAMRGSDGEIYGVPLAINAAVALYNKSVFDEYDVAVPETWPEFLDAAEALATEGITPVAQAGDAAYLLGLTHAAVAPGAYGPGFIDQIRSGDSDFTSPEFRASVQRMKDLEPYFPDNFVGISDDEARGMFATGEAAIYINGDYRIAPLRELNPELDMGIIPALPDSSTGQAQVSTWVDGAFAAVADSENVDAAKALLSFMTTNEFGAEFANSLTRSSAIPGVQVEDPLYQELLGLTENGAVPTLMHVDLAGGQPDTKEEFENALQGMYVGELEPDDVVDTVQRSAEAWYAPLQQGN